MSDIAVYLNPEQAEIFKEYLRQQEWFDLIINRVLDTRSGYVSLYIDDQGNIRKVETSRTYIVHKSSL